MSGGIIIPDDPDLTRVGPLVFNKEGEIINPDKLQAYQARPGRMRAYCRVYFNGQDLTSRLDPVLLSVRITSRKFGQSTCSLVIDDAYGRIPNPPDGARIWVDLGWADGSMTRSFQGIMADVVSMGQRRSGRTLHVEATSTDQLGEGKQPITGSWGSGKDKPKGEGNGGGGGEDEGKSFSDVAQEIAGKAGINLNIAPSIGQIKRKYWSIENEPPLGWLERTARELGGAFSVEGGQAGITDPKSGLNALGQKLPTIRAATSENVLAWAIRPSVGRAQWASGWHGFFDRDKAAWLTKETGIDGGNFFGSAKAKHMGMLPVNDEAMAKTAGAADNAASVAGRGTGWINIDGEPGAMAGGKLQAVGLRPGVDGEYTISEAEHSYFKGGGFLTRCDLENPQLGIGKIGGSWFSPN